MSAIGKFIVGEGNWLPIAMALALATASVQWLRHSRFAVRDRVMEAMNLFVGAMLLVMGIGHVLAVTAKLFQGTLNGSPALLYAIGAVIVIPSALILVNANRAQAAVFNGWMAAALVVLGLVNIPLAIPALLNIAYSKHSRPGAGVAIVLAFALVNLGLFTGGMLFLLSGARTFEEFQLTL